MESIPRASNFKSLSGDSASNATRCHVQHFRPASFLDMRKGQPPMNPDSFPTSKLDGETLHVKWDQKSGAMYLIPKFFGVHPISILGDDLCYIDDSVPNVTGTVPIARILDQLPPIDI